MNKTLQFIKYLENDFSEEEKSNFEKNLSLNHNLRKEFEKYQMNYKNLNSEIKAEEDYFITLLPRVKERISAKKKFSFYFNLIPKYAYLFPVILIAAVVIFLLNTYNSNIKSAIDVKNFTYAFSDNNELITELLDETSNYKIIENYDSEIYSLTHSEDEYENIILNYLKENNHIFELNESVINNLSEDDYNLVYNEIINKKIL